MEINLQNKEKLVLRLDDVGASSKIFEVYGIDGFRIAGRKIPVTLVSNFLFLKYIYPFRRWGPYREMLSKEWEEVLALLKKYRAKLTVGVTASWVFASGQLEPFPVKFPSQAAVLKSGVQEGLLEIANHGLTHCVVGKHLPRPFSSNRTYHREFWEWLPARLHEEHVKRSQDILTNYFGCKIETFVPPGNLWSEQTEVAAYKNGIRYISTHASRCKTGQVRNGIIFLSNDEVVDFHDRELVLNGIRWLENILATNLSIKFVTVREFLGGT